MLDELFRCESFDNSIAHFPSSYTQRLKSSNCFSLEEESQSQQQDCELRNVPTTSSALVDLEEFFSELSSVTIRD